MAIPKPKAKDKTAQQPADEPHDPDQAWYWTEGWQKAEREAEADLAAGRTRTFDTMEEFLADLDSDNDD
jgi:hypothetical protein